MKVHLFIIVVLLSMLTTTLKAQGRFVNPQNGAFTPLGHRIYNGARIIQGGSNVIVNNVGPYILPYGPVVKAGYNTVQGVINGRNRGRGY